ncbi:MAG: electron transfer flavoprotein subunit beta/FixA family protein [Planctomycetes bacterium]|nr:electron transfer flavoprotein subunit beta/FixA family protein [Planctomycetota bacterium]
MNIVVCAKQVPDTKNITGQAMKDDGTVNRSALPAVFNPEDLNAVEAALELRDRFGGTVHVLTMGPPTASEILRESLYRGADHVYLITDRRAAASDTLATSYILACAVKKLKPDIVLCGRQAIDGDTAQVGPQLAEKLGFTLITYLEEIVAMDKAVIKVKRNIGNGWEVVKARLPVLLTVMDSANTPRPRAAKRIMKYKKAAVKSELMKKIDEKLPMDYAADVKEAECQKACGQLAEKGLLIQQWNLEDIGADLAWCGMSGSPTKVHRIQSIVLKGGQYKEFPASDDGVNKLVGELIEDHTIG